MNIIIPMAGMGKRMRPHTLTVPKPLIPVAGKPIVQWLIEDIVKVVGQKVEQIAFVIGDFGEKTEKELIGIAESLGAKGTIHYQDEPLGTAHAILCAKEALSGPVIVAFADTLFRAEFALNTDCDGVIWVNQVDNPSSFGVIKMDGQGYITDFIEKPTEFVSDLAIIGIYYFKDGLTLRNEMQYLIDNDIKDKGEYQLTNALENMKNKGMKFKPGTVIEWLDCGNKNATVYTNQRVLENKKNEENFVDPGAMIQNSVIVPPCYIGPGVKLENAVVGPHASIGANTVVKNSIIQNSIIQNHSKISQANISNSMLGNYVEYSGKASDLSLGDYSVQAD